MTPHRKRVKKILMARGMSRNEADGKAKMLQQSYNWGKHLRKKYKNKLLSGEKERLDRN